jgi:HSP20 family molecular chaperone IbpA
MRPKESHERQRFRTLDDLLRGLGFNIPSGHGPFKLENGAEHLSAWFPKVEVWVHEDGLRVTEVEPLVRYVLSMPGLSPRDVQLDELRRIVEGEIARCGAFYITKSSGMFVAQGLARVRARVRIGVRV